MPHARRELHQRERGDALPGGQFPGRRDDLVRRLLPALRAAVDQRR